MFKNSPFVLGQRIKALNKNWTSRNNTEESVQSLRLVLKDRQTLQWDLIPHFDIRRAVNLDLPVQNRKETPTKGPHEEQCP